ncbi:signal peptidase II [Arenicella xantha]|uniref:Lipoprotein signal peptidase n=1 Tax=Arenicella xantha TaxID=644221 RepID=A0A395JQQ9_9GAMM|nr:signal peptidase II [Arenicella xantha]RBP52662.1 signal peptidase II [Arenicella xantha]
MQKTQSSNLKWLWLSLIVILVDQLTKYWAEHILGPSGVVEILPVFDLSLAHNTGSAFGMFSGPGITQHLFFVTLALIISVVLTVFIKNLKWFERHLALAYALIIGGAIGNAIDRVIYQYVVDFIHWFYQGWHYPHFNVADMAIFAGAALLIAEAFGKPFLNQKAS